MATHEPSKKARRSKAKTSSDVYASEGRVRDLPSGARTAASEAASTGDPEVIGPTDRPSVLIVPDANAAASEALRRWGFQVANRAERMRLGPPVAWHPERQFGLFNLFWG